MSGQIEILAQLKASNLNPGAVGMGGVEVMMMMMKGVRGPCHVCVQAAHPFWGKRGFCFIESP